MNSNVTLPLESESGKKDWNTDWIPAKPLLSARHHSVKILSMILFAKILDEEFPLHNGY